MNANDRSRGGPPDAPPAQAGPGPSRAGGPGGTTAPPPYARRPPSPRPAPSPVAPGTPAPTTPARPVAPSAERRREGPPEVAVQVGRALGLVRSAEEQLAIAFGLLADRHSRDAELLSILPLLAGWARSHAEGIAAFEDRFRIVPSEGPERLRAAVLGGTRAGSEGMLLDLQDLLTLTFSVKAAWIPVSQAAKELRDPELEALAADAGEQTDRAIAFLRTKLMNVAPQALTVPAAPMADVAAGLPKRASIGALPDLAWGPLVSAALVGFVGLAGVIVTRPILLPSLGPTAALMAVSPSQPDARGWNTIAGHAGGLLAGFLAVLIAGAVNAPTLFTDRVLAPERAVASIVAIGLTVLFGMLLRASHPPAAATTLLVSLGGIRTATDVLNLAVGIVLIAFLGELVRRIRIHGLPPKQIDRPASITARIRFLRPPG